MRADDEPIVEGMMEALKKCASAPCRAVREKGPCITASKLRSARPIANCSTYSTLRVRRFDHLGEDGIVAKRRQRNRRKGLLRFALRNRSQVRKVIARIKLLGEPAIQVRRFSNPNAYPY
jgi:hypothetical protein